MTLPHHDKVSKADWTRYGGPEGYVKNQGFYLYRNRRLIVHGTWFRSCTAAGTHEALPRVLIDIPNSLDSRSGRSTSRRLGRSHRLRFGRGLRRHCRTNRCPVEADRTRLRGCPAGTEDSHACRFGRALRTRIGISYGLDTLNTRCSRHSRERLDDGNRQTNSEDSCGPRCFYASGRGAICGCQCEL